MPLKRRMNIKSSEFVKSSVNLEDCPKTNLPEYAFIGRSNVGKSSLINMLCQKKGLAKTSNTPGKTQCINHFIINKEWYLVDLPGYGYARASKTERKKWSLFIEDYIKKRTNLIYLFVLVDSRHEPQKVDLDFINTAGEIGIPMCIVFTKLDKLTKLQRKENIEHYKNILLKSWEELPITFESSSKNTTGRDEILDFIAEGNVLFTSN